MVSFGECPRQCGSIGLLRVGFRLATLFPDKILHNYAWFVNQFLHANLQVLVGHKDICPNSRRSVDDWSQRGSRADATTDTRVNQKLLQP
jgi:hypothetical protein